MVLVAAEGFVIHSDALDRPSPEPEGMAEVLLAALFATRDRIGGFPQRVAVREDEVAAALTRLLEERAAAETAGGQPPAVRSGPVPDVDEAAYSLVEHSTGLPGRFLVSSPEAWAGWDLPEELVALLFRNAATFYRAAPWAKLTNVDAFEATLPAGNSWTVSVLGNGGEEFGLGLYSEADDFWSMVESDDEKTAFDDFAGRVVSLDLVAGGELPKAMRREIAAAGWEVAGPAAYPRLYAVNTPAGGIRRRDAEDLAALLAAVPRFVAVHGEAIAADGMVPDWRDDETGVVFSEPGGERMVPLVPLVPGCAEGPAAEPAAALAQVWAKPALETLLAEELDVVERYSRHLAVHESFSRATVAKHTGNAAEFVAFLAGRGVPVRAVHAADLLDFLFDWFPRRAGGGGTRRKALPGSLERFFRFLAREAGIECPWAWEILADREGFAERCEGAPAGDFRDPAVREWRAEHTDDLVFHVLLPDSGLGGADDEAWAPSMGPTEARLDHELRRRWLLWRDELLLAGVETFPELVRRLVGRQRQWEHAPHPQLAGKSPLAAIREERAMHKEAAGGAPQLDLFDP